MNIPEGAVGYETGVSIRKTSYRWMRWAACIDVVFNYEDGGQGLMAVAVIPAPTYGVARLLVNHVLRPVHKMASGEDLPKMDRDLSRPWGRGVAP